ncbi:MAG: hypothetical protein U5O39_12910 [Gammaproteobacteria bacterium]|nr:hypothetical protein [Gammaproteobacteria bacterium]
MQYMNESFGDERVDLDGKSFHNCEFRNCELVFSGDRPPTFSDNRFVDCVFVLTGAATRTLYLLSNIYHAGEGGQEVVENIFSELRDAEIHGHEIRTKVPNTKDHSLA